MIGSMFLIKVARRTPGRAPVGPLPGHIFELDCRFFVGRMSIYNNIGSNNKQTIWIVPQRIMFLTSNCIWLIVGCSLTRIQNHIRVVLTMCNSPYRGVQIRVSLLTALPSAMHAHRTLKFLNAFPIIVSKRV